MCNILNPRFRYVPARSTNIRTTLTKARRAAGWPPVGRTPKAPLRRPVDGKIVK